MSKSFVDFFCRRTRTTTTSWRLWWIRRWLWR